MSRLSAFNRSPLAAFERSPLGARNNNTPPSLPCCGWNDPAFTAFPSMLYGAWTLDAGATLGPDEVISNPLVFYGPNPSTVLGHAVPATVIDFYTLAGAAFYITPVYLVSNVSPGNPPYPLFFVFSPRYVCWLLDYWISVSGTPPFPYVYPDYGDDSAVVFNSNNADVVQCSPFRIQYNHLDLDPYRSRFSGSYATATLVITP